MRESATGQCADTNPVSGDYPARARHPEIRTTAQLIVGIPRTPVIPRGWGIRGGISLSRISPGWRGWWSIVIPNIRRCWRWGGWGGACRETNQQSRDQDYFDHFPSSLFIVVRKAFLKEIGQQSRYTRLSGILSSPCHSDPVSDFMFRNDACPKLMQNQGILVQSHPELRASENARRETILMRGLRSV